MPDNPDVATLLAHGQAVRAAQDKLRAAMAAVAAEVKQTAPVPPVPGGTQ